MKPATCTNIRWRRVRNGYEALAAAIVLQARAEWERLQREGRDHTLDRKGNVLPWPWGSDLEELREFLTSEWCAYLCEEGGIDHEVLLRQTVGQGA